MEYGLDWAVKKDNTIVSETGEIFSDISEITNGSTVYVEDSVPEKYLFQLFQKRCDINLIKGRDVKDYREENDIEKSDITDAQVLLEIGKNGYTDIVSLEKSGRTEKLGEYAIKMWNKLDEIQTANQNRVKGLRRNYPEQLISEVFDMGMLEKYIDTLEEKKKEMISLAKRSLDKEKIRLCKKIDGIGTRTAVKIIGLADPTKFDTLAKYLEFCGFTESAPPSLPPKSVIWLIAREQGMKWRHNEKLRELYELFREQGLNNAQALNRIATFLAKEIYFVVRDEEPPENVNLAEDILGE